MGIEQPERESENVYTTVHILSDVEYRGVSTAKCNALLHYEEYPSSLAYRIFVCLLALQLVLTKRGYRHPLLILEQQPRQDDHMSKQQYPRTQIG
jgi:hypothetical protein